LFFDNDKYVSPPLYLVLRSGFWMASKNKTNETPVKELQPPVDKNSEFPIVGIGASAGGLNAIQKLLNLA
jgi:chemotaxis response regulator CheB